MVPDSDCPSAEHLRRSLDPADPMPAAERQRIGAHVDRCTMGCKRTLEVLRRGHTVPPAPEATEVGNAPVGSVAAGRLGEGTLACNVPPPPIHSPTLPGYEILEEIGRGGMGVVYKARHVGLNRLVALKMILAGVHAAVDDLARFRFEAEAVAALQHPNVVQIYEIGSQDGRPYFSLEFVDGGNLAQKLAGAPQPPQQAAALVEILARAVHFAHQRGLIHRDLKPANVLLTADGRPRITDFGLVKRLDDAAGPTRSGVVIGTPSYMAPEQAAGKSKEVGPATDVYALGAILYECLTGRAPFKAATALETLQQVLADEPVPPRQLQSTTPRDLETICLKSLEKDPLRRYPRAEDMADDLRRFQAQEPIAARPVGPWTRAAKWARRQPAVAVSLAIAVFSLIAGTVASTCFAVVAEDGLKYAKVQEAIAKKQGALAEESRYAADMRLAQEAADEGNMGRAMNLLQRYEPRSGDPDLRGFEWRYLRWVCQGDSLATYRGHTDEVRSVAYSPDGNLLATGSADCTVRLLDAAAQTEIAVLRPEGAGVMSVAFSPDGRTLACATGNWRKSAEAGKVYLWDVPSLRMKGVLEGHKKSVNSVAFSPDGAFLATASEDNTVMLWTLGQEQAPVTFPGHSTGVNGVVFSPDSHSLAAGSGDGALQIWDVKTKRSITDSVVQVSGIMSLAFAPDGHTLVVGSRDGPILFWDRLQGKVTDVLDGKQGLVNAIAFSPNGEQFATAGSNCTVKIWNYGDRKQATLLRGHKDMVFSVAFSPRGKLLASGASDRTVKLWDGDRKRESPTLEQEAAVSGMAFSPDGKILATAGGESTSSAIEQQSTIHLWETATARLLGVLSGHTDIIYSVAFSPDGKTLASGSRDHTAFVWDLIARKKIMTLEGHTAPVLAVRFSPDGAVLATGGRDGAVMLWDAIRKRDAPLAALQGHQGWVRSVAFSPDGKMLVTASSDRTIRLWDVATRNPIAVMAGFQGACNTAEFSPDGKIVAAASNDRTVRLWDVGAGRYEPGDATVLQGYNAAINSLAFSPNGKTLAAGSQDSTVTLWSVEAKEEVTVFTPHSRGVLCVAFAPDGNLLATGSNDQTAKLWRAVGAHEAATLDEEREVWTRP